MQVTAVYACTYIIHPRDRDAGNMLLATVEKETK